MLQIIQNNLNICPKTRIKILWGNIANGIKISNDDYRYIAKISGIKKLKYIENGCWVIDKYDNKWWYKFGKKHRDDGPAIEYVSGSKFYYQDGKKHRIDGPAFINTSRYKEYWQDGKLHRLDGPAIEYADGFKIYYQNGKRHRIDGPAVVYSNGAKAYYLNGKHYSEKEYWTKNKIVY